MRVLFSVFPATAHLYPIVPLAHALQSMGHEVCVAASPDLVDDITGVGLKAVPIGEIAELGTVLPQVASDDQVDRLARWLEADPTDPRVRKAVRYRLLSMITLGHAAPGRAPALEDLVGFARYWKPDLVLWDPMCFGAALAARACGAAHARILWGLDYFAWYRERYEVLFDEPGEFGESLLLDGMEPTLRGLGTRYDQEALVGQWSVDLMSQRMRLPSALRYVPLRRVPYNGPAVFPEWLREKPDRPRICLTLGLSVRKYFKEDETLVTGLLNALADLDAEIVATINGDQFDGSFALPPNVRAVDFVPLDLLLPSCSAIVHHGGTSTYAAAVAQAVPQLVLPTSMGDHLALSKHIVERGAGLFTERDDVTADAVRGQLTRILEEPSFREGAEGLYRDSLASPGPAEIVPLLERLALEYRG